MYRYVVFSLIVCFIPFSYSMLKSTRPKVSNADEQMPSDASVIETIYYEGAKNSLLTTLFDYTSQSIDQPPKGGPFKAAINTINESDDYPAFFAAKFEGNQTTEGIVQMMQNNPSLKEDTFLTLRTEIATDKDAAFGYLKDSIHKQALLDFLTESTYSSNGDQTNAMNQYAENYKLEK